MRTFGLRAYVLNRHGNVWVVFISTFLIFFVIGMLYEESNHKNLRFKNEEMTISMGTHSIKNVSGLFTPVTVPVFTYNSGMWRKNFEICRCHEGEEDFPLFSSVKLTSVTGDVPLYVHNPEKNQIFQEILKSGNFEPKIFQNVITLLRQNSEMSFINIGFDLGVYSVQVAKLGRQVMHIDASLNNIRELCASILQNEVEYDVTIVHGNISQNFGQNSNCNYDENENNLSKLDFSENILNHILAFPYAHLFRKGLIRIDIGGQEHKLLSNKSDTFFKNVDVIGILIGWKNHMHNMKSRQQIKTFLTERGFVAYQLKGVTKFPVNVDNIKEKYALWLPRDMEIH